MADLANLIIDVTMDVSLASKYIDLFDSSNRFYNRVLGTIVSSAVDSSIDIIQTRYIYNLNTEQINNKFAQSDVKYLYLVGYAL